MSYIFIFIVLPFIGFSLFNLIKTIVVHKRKMRRLDEFSSFNKTVIEWSDEIANESVKLEFINYCANLVTYNYEVVVQDYLNNGDKIEEIKHDLFLRFGNHIPSLKKEFRSNRLDKILS